MRGHEDESRTARERIQSSEDHPVPDGVRDCPYIERRVLLIVQYTAGALVVCRVRERDGLHVLNVTSSF